MSHLTCTCFNETRRRKVSACLEHLCVNALLFWFGLRTKIFVCISVLFNTSSILTIDWGKSKILSLRKNVISSDFHFLENKHGDTK